MKAHFVLSFVDSFLLQKLISMRTMFTFGFFLLISLPMVNGQVEEKTFVQSFNMQGKKSVTLDLPGYVLVKEWPGEVLRIQMNVSLEKGVPNTLKGLATTGRYLVRPQLEDDMLKIAAPGLEKKVTYRGVSVEESIHFIIHVPVGTRVEDRNGELLTEEAI